MLFLHIFLLLLVLSLREVEKVGRHARNDLHVIIIVTFELNLVIVVTNLHVCSYLTTFSSLINHPLGLWYLRMLWRYWIDENVSTESHPFRERSHIDSSSSCCSLLLLLLSLFVLFLFIWCRLSIVICEVYLICKFDAKWASLDPWSFWFQWNSLASELGKHRSVIHTRNHIWRLDERKWKTWFHKDWCSISRESEASPGHSVAKSWLLREHWKLDLLFLIKEFLSILRIIFVCSLKIALALSQMSWSTNCLPTKASQEP